MALCVEQTKNMLFAYNPRIKSSCKVTVVTLVLPMVRLISPGNCSNLFHISHFAKMYIEYMNHVVIFQYTHIFIYAHMSCQYFIINY